jgi:hypothetical protein
MMRSEKGIAMSEPAIAFKLLEDCVPRDLIRINLGESTEWALVSTKGHGLLVVVVLSGAAAPYCFNAMGSMGVKPEFEHPILCYGNSYILTPDHTGACDVNSGRLFGANGSLLLSEVNSNKSLFLRCDFPERGTASYYNIAIGSLGAEPGGGRASFGQWSLGLKNTVSGSEYLTYVVEFLCT